MRSPLPIKPSILKAPAVQHLDLFLELEADRMAHVMLDETGFIAEQKIVMEERRLRTADEPGSDLWEQVSAAAFTAHPYGWPVVGWMHDLEAINPGRCQSLSVGPITLPAMPFS